MLDRDALHRIYAAKVTDGAPTPEEHLAGLEAVAAAVRGEMRAQLCEALGPVGKGLAWETALGLVDKPERAEVSVEQIKALFAAPLAWDDLCNQPSEERLVRVFNAGRTADRLRPVEGGARTLRRAVRTGLQHGDEVQWASMAGRGAAAVIAIHCPGAPPGYPPRGSICRHDCTGPYATRAADVTCRRCLARGAQAITKAFSVQRFEASKLPADDFHAHLDACRQCREEPFNLCQVGAGALAKAAGGKP